MSHENFQRDLDDLSRQLDEVLGKSSLQIYPAKAYTKCYGILDTWLNNRYDLHERIPEEAVQENLPTLFSQQICLLYLKFALIFFNANARSSAMALLIHGWNKLGQRQLQTGHRIYRASIAFNLAQLAYFQGDIGAATWWALHAQADDHLGADWEGGLGRDMLITALGMSQIALDEFRAIGDSSRNIAQSENNWTISDSFAENVVVRFVLEKRALSYILGSNSTTLEYPISSAYFETLLNVILLLDTKSEGKKVDHEKGKALEKLAAYLLMLIPGWLPLRNMEDEKRTTEIDLVVRNVYPNGNLMADIFGRYFIVECKNWKKPVGSRDVGYFINKIRQSHASFGIIFSKKGITGSGREERAAKELTRRAFHEDKTVCIVISYADLERLKSGETTFRSLLLELFEEFRFGRSKNQG